MAPPKLSLLLDTHALIWWFTDDERLSPAARAALLDEQNKVHVSAASAYEITFKHRRGRLSEVNALVGDYEGYLARQGFRELPITTRHALAAGRLTLSHGDPWDRLLIAHATLDELTLVSNEELFDATGVKRLW